MLTITADNVNDAYNQALWTMKIHGKPSDSRNGKVLRVPSPVVTCYRYPTERMLFDPTRDANPYFHIFESIWMLAGRNDVAFPAKFAAQIYQYSDDGKTLSGAYGFRWRSHFEEDQLSWVIKHLKNNPSSRRAVITMWDGDTDPTLVENGTKDVPCNTGIYFSMRGKNLDMTVTNRSNDIVWGCYGANAVHMSMLQQFVAEALGVHVGKYYQFSNDWHVYEQHFPLVYNADTNQDLGLYPTGETSLVGGNDWSKTLSLFDVWCSDPDQPFAHPYIRDTLVPMYTSWAAYKAGDREGAEDFAWKIKDGPIRVACLGWLGRRAWK